MKLRSLRAGDQSHQLIACRLSSSAMANDAAIAHRPDLIREPHHLIKIVTNKQEYAALVPQPFYQVLDRGPFS